MKTTHTMNEILWTGSSVGFDDGPASSIAIPLANMITVVSTMTGAIPRSSGCGGPFDMYVGLCV